MSNQGDSNQFLQLTAMLYLQEALDNQQYELCKELLAKAKELGIKNQEINMFLESYSSDSVNVRGLQVSAQDQQSRVRS